MFKHYIFTRYNWELYSKNPYNINNLDVWMENRLGLYEEYLKGLKSQTNKNFTALVVIDPETPEGYKRQIYNATTLDNVRFIEELPQDYIKKLTPQTEWLITSRCDNDDYYLPNFVKEIQDSFRPQTHVKDIVVKQVRGDKETLKAAPSNNSSFTTLIEPWKNPKTIFTGEGHTFLPKYFSCEKVSSEPLAVRQIHGMNAYYK